MNITVSTITYFLVGSTFNLCYVHNWSWRSWAWFLRRFIYNWLNCLC